MTKKQCIIVAGPTAIGKTAEAIRLAKQYDTSIVSADSRQCYRELNIGVARPSEEEIKEVKHYFIANHSITENISAASFATEARVYLNEIFKYHDVAIVCGGTGLYIKALVEGLDEIPPIPTEIRDRVIQLYKEKGIDALRKKLLELDPNFAVHGDVNNPQRMMRAVEVVMFTGSSIFEYHTNKLTVDSSQLAVDSSQLAVDSSQLTVNSQQTTDNRQQSTDNSQPTTINRHDITFKYKILNLPRAELYERINKRVDQMITDGLEDEARSLIAFRDLPALQTVGYKEFFDCFDGKCTRDEAIEKIKQHTRNYAKRQITWFKRVGVDS
jgi:tRNA dimethylallyltransferase